MDAFFVGQARPDTPTYTVQRHDPIDSSLDSCAIAARAGEMESVSLSKDSVESLGAGNDLCLRRQVLAAMIADRCWPESVQANSHLREGFRR